MINPQRSFNIHYYIDIFLRRIWYILIPLVVVFVGASIYALTAPKVYRSTTLVLVTPQKIPEAIIKPTVTSSIEDRLQSIGQEVMSRTRLEKIIAEFKLYPKEIKSLSKEEVVELMRKNIKIEIKGVGEGSRASKTEGYFTISYFGEDPQVVTMVTNKLASLFIEENLKIREQQAQGTVEFVSSELKKAKEKLDEQDKEITAFKRQNLNELPEQRDANLKVLEQLQLQRQRINESLGKAEDRKLILQNQLSPSKVLGIPAQIDASTEEPSNRPSQSSPLENLSDKQLFLLKAQLEELLSKYTPRHPDVVITKKKIAELEKNIKESERPVISPEKPKPVRKVDPIQVQSKLLQEERKNQLLATDLEIKQLKNEDAKLKTMMSEYQARIEKTPMRELTLNALSRDYKNTYETYQSLLQKNEVSQQAENLERRQKGEQFKILDPARIPEKPFKPDIPQILLIGLLLGVGTGIGIAFLREQMDRSFRDPEDLTISLGIKVLANIPRVDNKAV